MPNNVTVVCFDCRRAYRIAVYADAMSVCSGCRRPCVFLGDRIRIPSRANVKAWKVLRQSIQDQRHQYLDQQQVRNVRSRHQIERRIQTLESQPKDSHRERELIRLRKCLNEWCPFDSKSQQLSHYFATQHAGT